MLSFLFSVVVTAVGVALSTLTVHSSFVDGFSSPSSTLPSTVQPNGVNNLGRQPSCTALNNFIDDNDAGDCSSNDDDENDGSRRIQNHERLPTLSRREMLTKTALWMSIVSSTSIFPQQSWAGIDVSGLRVEGGGSSNAVLQQQLKSYDGSGSARVRQLQDLKESSSTTTTTTTSTAKPSSSSSVDSTTGSDQSSSQAATYAYRYNPGLTPQLKKAGIAGERYKYSDSLELVSSSSPSSSRGYVNVQFEFPSDWLQLDRSLGGIQYVDQRNGDKLIVLKSNIPSGESLISVPKQWFAQTIFDPKGTVVSTTGIDVDEFKASKSTILNDGISTSTSPHRRVLLKYSTVTPNGLRTERRGLVDAYEINNVAYMMFTGSNAVKFDKNGPERETVERIVDSFVVEAIR